MREGIQGLTRDKTRPSRIAPLPAESRRSGRRADEPSAAP
jgi:hypothetical protein